MFARFVMPLLVAVSLPTLADSQGYSFGQPAKATEAQRTVEVILGDIYYKPTAIEVKAGETVRFVVRNEGKLLHEFSLGDARMHARHQEEMLQMTAAGMITPTGIKPMDHSQMDHSQMGHGGHGMDHGAMSHDEPNSLMVEPGKSAELTWTFRASAGLQFACNLPGHYQAGMVGELKVAPAK
ncbi:cupredoxin domain-containing protein [Pseudomonas sp. LRF_L74]|uniref:cupredoxin domain-containing protein n=1 Tax=Pseudomonas sp. LRF_L74 TaxID=3369422 RepID=UPI003F5D6CDB